MGPAHNKIRYMDTTVFLLNSFYLIILICKQRLLFSNFYVTQVTTNKLRCFIKVYILTDPWAPDWMIIGGGYWRDNQQWREHLWIKRHKQWLTLTKLIVYEKAKYLLVLMMSLWDIRSSRVFGRYFSTLQHVTKWIFQSLVHQSNKLTKHMLVVRVPRYKRYRTYILVC